jgi:hypothetical protein
MTLIHFYLVAILALLSSALPSLSERANGISLDGNVLKRNPNPISPSLLDKRKGGGGGGKTFLSSMHGMYVSVCDLFEISLNCGC